MRGDAGLTARLLLRGAGFAGVVTAVGGGVVIAGALRPWYAIVAEVSMLGGVSERTVAWLPGFPATSSGWAVACLGLVVLGLGVLVALDRQPVRARAFTVGIGVVTLAVAAFAAVSVPGLEAIAAETSRELLDVRDQLPVGVELELRAIATSGPWWVAAGAATAIVGALGARDR